MNFNLIKKSFNQVIEMLGGGWVALFIALVVIGLVLFFIFRSGKQIKIRIPFLPRGMNTFTIGKDDLKKLPGGKSGEEGEAEEPLVGKLFEGIDLLSGSVKNRYDLPLYMVVSQYDQVNSLIGQAGDDILQRLDLKGQGGTQSGSCVILNQGGLIYHESPDLIAQELIAARPERPLDGVVIVVPVGDLTMNDRVERRRKIDWLFKQYWSIQNKIDFKLPVYFMISGTEDLEGFDEFWRFKQGESELNEIFGWSNPRNADAPFELELVDEAFATIDITLRNEIAELLARRNEGLGGLLAFPHSVRMLIDPVKEFTAAVFESSALIHPAQFRGLYFCGQQGGNHKFLERLFRDKIFPERSVAVPVREQLLSADSNLRRLQIGAIAGLFALVGWTGWNLDAVARKSSDIIDVAERVKDAWRSQDKYRAIESSLGLLGDLDASKFYCCGPTPWSLFVSPDMAVEQFFERELFAQSIFPAMECKSRQRIRSNLIDFDVASQDGLWSGEYSSWLARLLVETKNHTRLKEITGEIDRPQDSVAAEFVDLIDQLFDKKLPENFGENADLYLLAIAANDYDGTAMTSINCPSSLDSVEEAWDQIVDASFDEISREVERAAAPIDFVRAITSLESKSLESTRISPEAFSRYVEWHSYLTSKLSNYRDEGFCSATSKRLELLADDLSLMGLKRTRYQGEIRAFKEECDSRIRAQMESDNTRLPRKLYQTINDASGNLAPKLTAGAAGVFRLISELSTFSFSSITDTPWSKTVGPFFWSVDLLGQALGFSENYMTYANTNFQTSYLPANPTEDTRSYLAQAVALAQLQRAMMSTIERAKVDPNPPMRMDLSTLDVRETQIADRVANFSKALAPLLELVSTFEQLGLSSARKRLLMQSHAHAVELLKDIDALYDSNRLYEPRKNPNWKANQYVEAFYGLITDSNAKDYLSAQARRARIIAQDYAQPVVIFLTNTEGEFRDSDLLAKWRRTLVEINKRENKDPSNDINGLEQFFLGDFLATDFSNCHDSVKAYSPPTGNNLFAISWRKIIEVSTRQCQRLRADEIQKEYASVAQAFEKYLAPYYPFNRSTGAKPLSPNSLRSFIGIYEGRSDGLAERVRVLAWKEKTFSDSELFLRDLDASLDILSAVLDASNGSSPGLSVGVVFDPDISSGSKIDLSSHIAKKQLSLGDISIESPGLDKQVSWKFSDPISFDLHWASGSPYQLLTDSGDNANGRLNFWAKGYWSLLRFIDRFQSTRTDNFSLDEESLLLEFAGGVRRSTSSNEITPIQVFLRMTLSGLDRDTNEERVLPFPARFPESAPMNT